MSATTTSQARDVILGRIRAALADVPPGAGPEESPVAWAYGRATRLEDVLGRFAERVEDYKAQVIRCAAGQVPERIAQALRDRGVATAVLPAGLDAAWRDAVAGAGVTVRVDGEGTGPLRQGELDATDAVVTAAAVGIAQTGTIVLDHAPDQGRRALTLVPDVHVCVVRADQVVSDVPEAVARLAPAVRAGAPLTWISGPSATSDIELARVEGVHGPRTLVMILAD